MVSISTLTAWLTHAICLCGVIPFFPWIGPAPRAALLIGFAASIWQQWRGCWPLKNWMLNSAIIPVFLFYLQQYRSSNAVQPVASVLAFMLAIRLISEKSVRHHLQAHLLGLFCLAATSLFALNLSFLVYLAMLLFLEAPALMLLTYQTADSALMLQRDELRKVLTAGILLPLASLPLMLLFFPVLPRTQLPMWNFSAAPVSQTTGFSEKVEPGASASQGVSRERVFRAEMPRVAVSQPYWRVTVFNRFDGTRWQRSAVIPTEGLPRPRSGIEQTVFLEPLAMRYLPLLDAPVAVDGAGFSRAADSVYERSRGIGKRVSYRAVSDHGGHIPVKAGIRFDRYLELPAVGSAAMRQLSDRIRRQGRTAMERVELLEAFFRNGGYRYSRQGMPTGEQAMNRFLFETRQGNCEFFASAFAQLLRGAGVPARLVGGYLGGEYNDVGGYYLVSEDMAHVWVEVLLAAEGWRRIDPSSFAANAGEVWGRRPSPGTLARLRLMLDACDYYWNRSVVGYDFERQFQAAQEVGRRLQWGELRPLLKRFLPVLAAAGAILAAACLGIRRPWMFARREERILRAFYRRLERDCAMRVEPGRLGVFELASLSGSSRAREFAETYGGVIYRGRRLSRAEFIRLRALCRAGFRPDAADGRIVE